MIPNVLDHRFGTAHIEILIKIRDFIFQIILIDHLMIKSFYFLIGDSIDKPISQQASKFPSENYIFFSSIGKNQVMSVKLFFLFQHPKNRNKRRDSGPSGNKISRSFIINRPPYIMEDQLISLLQHSY